MGTLEYLAMGLTALVALEHFYILVLEMFLWTTPKAMKTFGTERAFAESTRAMAKNQGLYNGFLAAGLVWGLVHPDPAAAHDIRVFFLGCVIVAAVYGSLTVKKSIVVVQGLPAILALAAVLLAGR